MGVFAAQPIYRYWEEIWSGGLDLMPLDRVFHDARFVLLTVTPVFAGWLLQYALRNSTQSQEARVSFADSAFAAFFCAVFAVSAVFAVALYNMAKDILGNGYGAQTVDRLPGVPLATYNALSDVAGSGFWTPFLTPSGTP
ncbi:MAG: hypothetical protein M3O09_13865, partial [Acidobacteriota bacterium]|nr:hypothetical protein [Acidobacteriota bacterium]